MRKDMNRFIYLVSYFSEGKDGLSAQGVIDFVIGLFVDGALGAAASDKGPYNPLLEAH